MTGLSGSSGLSGPAGAIRRLTDQASVLLAPNPGPMTLDGTNSYLLSGTAPTSSLIVVDPGPGRRRATWPHWPAAGPVELILDHPPAPRPHRGRRRRSPRLTGAPVRAADPALLHRRATRCGTARSSTRQGLSSTVHRHARAHRPTRCASCWPDDGPTGVGTDRGHHPGPRHHGDRAARTAACAPTWTRCGCSPASDPLRAAGARPAAARPGGGRRRSTWHIVNSGWTRSATALRVTRSGRHRRSGHRLRVRRHRRVGRGRRRTLGGGAAGLPAGTRGRREQ